jgi:hypothetical protein
MKKHLRSSSFEYEKSSYKFDLFKHDLDSYYLEIHQTISGSRNSQSLKLKTQAIRGIIEELQGFQKFIYSHKRKETPVTSIHQKIEDRYLRGVPIKDLAMQFDETEDAIKNLLISRGIQIVNLKPPVYPYWKRKKR